MHQNITIHKTNTLSSYKNAIQLTVVLVTHANRKLIAIAQNRDIHVPTMHYATIRLHACMHSDKLYNVHTQITILILETQCQQIQ